MTSFPTAASKEALEQGETLSPRFDAAGLIAALATHADTGEVLMLAWMNAEALARTLATGEAHYFSRSRNELWHKGATSGQVQVRFEPPLAGFSAPSQLPLSQGPCSDWRRQLQADFSQPQQVRFAGRYPASCGEREWPVAYPEPEAYAPRVMQALWLGAGGLLTGQVRYGTRPATARLLLEAPSLPLSEIIQDINKFSNNVMAQQLYLTLSSALGAPGRFEASRVRLSQWWRQGFAGHDEPVLDNGSGLSRNERSTAQALTALLQAAHAGPHARHFVASLSLAGVDGTSARLKERNPQSPVIGKAWLKTGSLRDVASVAGYVQGQSGQRYTVVAIINHPNASQARPALDQLLLLKVLTTEAVVAAPRRHRPG